MTIEQEALAIFAAGLAAFLDQAVARLDEPGPKPVEAAHEEAKPSEAEKPAKKPRKKKAAAESPVAEGPTEARDVTPDVVIDAATP
jgi:hypothetical protein